MVMMTIKVPKKNKKAKVGKSITAKEANELLNSKIALQTILSTIQRSVEVGNNMCAMMYISPYVEIELLKLGYTIERNTYGTINVRWDREQTSADLDIAIAELTKRRDELKQLELVEQLSGLKE